MVPYRRRLLRLRDGLVLVCAGWLRQDGFAERERKFLLGAPVAVVGADDALDKVMTDDIDVLEVAEADSLDAVENVQSLEQAGPLRVRAGRSE